MSDPSKKVWPVSEANNAAARLKRITELWQQLQLTRSNTAEYDGLIDQIRGETDAFRKILDAKQRLGHKDPKE